jgi:P27 family predicted phage terminase small subunit
MGGTGSGRRPQPTALKIARGNPGKRALPVGEPQPQVVRVACPAWLTGEGAALFERLAAELADLQLLAQLDGESLAMYCSFWEQFRTATRHIERDGYTVKQVNKAGEPYSTQSPWVHIRHKATAELLAIARRFGFTPADRVGLAAAPADDVDPITAMALRHQQQRQAAG